MYAGFQIYAYMYVGMNAVNLRHMGTLVVMVDVYVLVYAASPGKQLLCALRIPKALHVRILEYQLDQRRNVKRKLYDIQHCLS